MLSPNDRSWKGLIDEVRISKRARSADWLEACYRNQSNPGNYLLFQEEEVLIEDSVYSDEGFSLLGPSRTVALSINKGIKEESR